jgi:epoxyqueuosine reductase QueG
MNAVELKEKAKDLGTDLIGIAPISRLENLPLGANPRSILPKVASVVVVGRRILRGAYRGVEEGTSFYSTYMMFGAGWQELQFLSKTVYELACLLESTGAEAVPMSGGNPPGEKKLIGSSGVSANVALDYRVMAHAAGLGSVGKGGFILTPQFGHRQRFGLILTDLKLDADEVQNVDLCNGCEACLKACPHGAVTDTGAARFEMAQKLCTRCQNGVFHKSALESDPLDRSAALRACVSGGSGGQGW